MFRCTTGKYDSLYARWLVHPGNLLDVAGWEPGKKLLDLCGGTGAVTREALRRGAIPEEITLLDLNPRYMKAGVRQVQGEAERARSLLPFEKYDVIVCRQAFGYLNRRKWEGLVDSLYRLLLPGGKLVFNTFQTPKWSFSSYLFDGNRYFEISGYLGHRVFHIQASPFLGFDLTFFQWHEKEDIFAEFSKRFKVVCKETEKSLRWVCTREPEHAIAASQG